MLSDVDFLAKLGQSLPAEVTSLLDRAGVQPEQLRGLVRSITYRAVKA